MSEKKTQVFVINGGSSSIKVSLFDQQDDKNADPILWTSTLSCNLLESSDNEIHELILNGLKKQKADPANIVCVGHRVVHGGPEFTKPVIISEAVEKKIEELCEIAPVHNPIALKLIRACRKVFPNAKQLAVFDTAFHSTLSKEAYIYPVPYEWYEKYGIRRFGFHGISHQYNSVKASSFFPSEAIPKKLVIAHLGNGCSVAATRNGASVDTSMGFTPLEGLMMGARSGSIDPGIIFYLMQEKKIASEELDRLLNQKSGLAGVSGIGKDMREIEGAMKKGNERARLSFDIFVRRIVSGITSMFASLNGAEAIVFTGGIGEHSSAVRKSVCDGLNFLGVELDESKNTVCTADGIISSPSSRVVVLRITSREDLQIFHECSSFLG